MSLFDTIKVDVAVNRGNAKGTFVVVAYRLCRAARGTGDRRNWWSAPILLLYKFVVEWVIGIDLPPTMPAGPGLNIIHGVGLVIHPRSVVGSHVTMRQGVTLGIVFDDAGGGSAAPVIGDHVTIGSTTVVLGPITVGDYAIVGAGSVVNRDVPPGAVVAGCPAKVLRYRDGFGPDGDG